MSIRFRRDDDIVKPAKVDRPIGAMAGSAIQAFIAEGIKYPGGSYQDQSKVQGQVFVRTSSAIVSLPNLLVYHNRETVFQGIKEVNLILEIER